MILRVWKSTIRSTDLDQYVAYISDTGAADYAATDGNCGFEVLARNLAHDLVEVTTLSGWRDLEAVKAFAGEDYERARYYPDDDRYLVDKSKTVEHFTVIAGSSRRTNHA